MKYIFVLVERDRRLFAEHQTLSSLSIGFSVAGLDHFYQFQSFLSIVVIVISILLKTTFSQITGENFIAIGQRKNLF